VPAPHITDYFQGHNLDIRTP